MSPLLALLLVLLTLFALWASRVYTDLLQFPRAYLRYVTDVAACAAPDVRIRHGASVTPFYGDSLRQMQNVKAGRPLAIVEEAVRDGYDLSLVFFGREPRFYVHNGDFAYRLLHNRDTALDPFRRARFRVMYPKSLIANDGRTWKRYYDLFRPMFNDDLMDRYHDVIGDVVQDQIGRQFMWHCPAVLARRTGVRVDLVALFKVLAARVIGACAFGDRLDEPGAAERVARANTEMFAQTASYMNSICAQAPSLRWLPTPLRQRATAAAAACRSICAELIDARLSGQRRGIASDDDFAARAIEFMRLGKGTRSEVLDNSSLLIVAGHETTAYTMAWMGYLMGRNPDLYARCRDEVRRVMGPYTEVLPEHIPQMPYLQATITETLRLFPPIAFIERKCTKAFRLSDDVELRPGTSLTVDVFGIHHNPRHWPDPYTADPTRHLDADTGRYRRPSERAFFAFSAGRRQCPGMRFARREVALTWAHLLRQYDLEWHVDDKIPIRLGITIAPNAPIHCVLTPVAD